MGKRNAWRDLSPQRRRLITAGGALQAALQIAALADLARRDRDEINGPKALWAAVSFVNFLGPIAYFAVGRRRGARH